MLVSFGMPVENDTVALLKKEELLIASVTSQNLERDDLWYKENFELIKKSRDKNPWWQANSIFIEKKDTLNISKFIRSLLDIGYERAPRILGKGLFASRGGMIEIWPINEPFPVLIEFFGNEIADIYQRPAKKEEIKKPRVTASLEKIPAGSYVVHVDHGIGRFAGFITSLNDAGYEDKYAVIEYAAARTGGYPDKLFVPSRDTKRVSPYLGFDTPKIHRLGGSMWISTRKKIKEETEKLASELLKIYASRSIAKRVPFADFPEIEDRIRESFKFEETPDQKEAESEIISDLEKDIPMDRLLCGDVGFGKTEIALRSAVRVAASGKQVAILAPTTILASQHFKTWSERLEPVGFKVEMLSRLRTVKEAKKILQDLALGKIDFLIGTHQILGNKVFFKNLGLIIIDEEQRFGVKQKEKFKSFRTQVDVLALSATPIPRTLQFTLTNLRSVSIIKTPPPDRLAIETIVLPRSDKIIMSAIEMEISRDGQVYFLHNKIDTMGHTKKTIEDMINKISGERKEAAVEVIHGRMTEKDIIKAMDNFISGKTKVLVATTIIENGLDISNANTLIVEDATRLGLAEAHQLRGRIGRSDKKAYAYFLYPAHLAKFSENTEEPKFYQANASKALERLDALQEYADLGSGYEIAMRDLSMRGAGNILGREQSGAINKVGLNLYYQMLAESIEEGRLLSKSML